MCIRVGKGTIAIFAVYLCFSPDGMNFFLPEVACRDSGPLQFPQPLLQRYTFPELLAAYSSDYSPSDLRAYWRDAMAPEFVKDGKKSPVVVHVRVNWILGCTDLDVTILNRSKPSISMGHFPWLC